MNSGFAAFDKRLEQSPIDLLCAEAYMGKQLHQNGANIFTKYLQNEYSQATNMVAVSRSTLRRLPHRYHLLPWSSNTVTVFIEWRTENRI